MPKSKPRKPAASLSSSLLEIKDFQPEAGAAAPAKGEARTSSGTRRSASAKRRKSGEPAGSKASPSTDWPVAVGDPSAGPPAQIQFLFPEKTAAGTGGSRADCPGPEHFLDELRGGRFAEAEAIFARITDLGPKTVKKILYGKKFETLAIACRAIGFEPLEFTTVLAILRGSKGDERLQNFDRLRDSLDFFNRVDRDDALKILANLPQR